MWTTGIVLALLLFWGVGAYNRLVRLRSAAIRAFGAVDAQMQQWLALLADFARQTDRGTLQSPDAGALHERAALSAAGTQFSASLAVARARPLDAAATAALAAGMQILDAAWQALVQAAALHSEGVAPPAMAPWLQQREQLGVQSALAQQQFNLAVTHYNAAVAQFPANVLAWLFGFERAGTL